MLSNVSSDQNPKFQDFSQLSLFYHLDIQNEDAEGRNVIVLCLLNSSVDVLREIHQVFSPEFDMSHIILKTEYDFNPAINMALSLAAFRDHRKKSFEMVYFLISLITS